MRQYIPVITLAAALALLVGVLLPSDNLVFAADPEFPSSESGDRNVDENTPPGVNIGDPISATDDDEDGENNNDIEFGDTLTYSLSGTDAASFDIDASTGQLITKASLNFENPRGGTGNNSNNYLVTVTVKDSSGASDTQNVTIEVTDVPEKPGAPAAPTVVSTDSGGTAYELKVIWYEPEDTGDSVSGYEVQYKKSTAASFIDDDHSGTSTSTTIDELDAETSYQVRVRAKDGNNPSDLGPWSLSSVGSTNKEDNGLPTFTEGDSVTRTMLENADAGLVVGAPVSATDTDNVLPLTYLLHGPDADSFDLQASTGQIRTKRGVVYDAETNPTLNVTVIVSDRQGGSDARAVMITVVNVPEAPSAPARPPVRATPGSSRSLDVTWSEPENMGPAISSYDVRYRKSGSNDQFRTVMPSPMTTNATIAPEDDNLGDGDDRLTPGASYEVSVRAQNGEIPSQWSAAGTGRTSIGNSEPRFDDRSSLTETDPTTTRTVAENTRSGQSVGRAVRAVDGNGDTRTYRLVTATEAAHVAKFDINESSGQILTKDPLNHEASDCGYVDTANPTTCTYAVKVEVWDGLDEDRNEEDTASVDDMITVNITVSDVVERPAAPTVTVTSPNTDSNTTLVVTWDVRENTGQPITGYRLECTGTDVPDDQCPKDDLASDATMHTITGLTADKSYRVRLRAENAEGDGAWSSWVTQSTNKEGNTVPTPSTITQLYVAENAPSTREPVRDQPSGGQVVTVSGTPGDSDTLNYRLKGPGAGRFNIDRNGQITTRSKLNHEDPECGYDSAEEGSTTSCSYSVRVEVYDSNGGSAFHTLTITVTDADESPTAPSAPRVTATSGSGWSLEVTWNEPNNTGPAITGYEIRYRKTGDSTATWQQWTHTGTGRSDKITTIQDPENVNTQVHLEPGKQYEVQVRALNGEGDSDFANATNWSTSGRGTTGASNRRPVFDSTLPAVVMMEVEENTRSGQSVGDAVEATDPDGNRLNYTLDGPNKDSFTITSAGQIRTRSSLNHEERDEYALTVKVNDGQRKNNSVAAKSVTIKVTDRPETPSAPAAPRVAGIPGSTDSVRVMWDEPANMGPAITHYRVQYAVSGSHDAFNPVDPPEGNADRSAIITGLTAGTRYDVQVRAETPEGHSDWSRSGTGSPNPDMANRPPAFTGGARTFSVAENTPPSSDVGSLVAALDPDGDVLTYILEGVDADSFDIIATNSAGQIQTKDSLNFEEKSSYSVAVRVRDGRGGTDAVNVSIRVTDVDGEAPDTPFAPTVTALSSTSLQVNWDAPDNTGPPITDYDYRYRDVSAQTWTEVTNTTITRTTETVDGLTPSTSYDVEVRAKNAEGTSEWSNPGNRATNAPGANNLPVFSEGGSATRIVSASAQPGTNIGDPVAATDADSGDTLTYRLEGRDAANFDIDPANGQLRTRTGITLFVGETYTVTVVADDTKDRAEITVTIEATAAPLNAVPAFAEGAATTRSVFEGTPAGTNIGSPVRATDADTGDTITYSLEGTDQASFDIVASSGQLLTSAALDASTKAAYTVTVVASDGKARATITVTITVALRPNSPPVFSEGVSTSRSVVEPVAPFTEIGSPVVATDADDDTLTYTIGGTDAASFFIDPSTGQLFTRIELTVDTKATYAVTVVASDGEASSRITVTINVTPPPNNVPVFNEGTSATRSVRDDATSGANIGSPVRATDADAGDTITYSLEGTDAASFAIVASSGQIQASAALDASTKSSYTVDVVASDGKGRATINVTITVTAAPTSFGCATNGAVADASNTGLVADCEALLRARNTLEGSSRLNWSARTPIEDWDGVYRGGTPLRVTWLIIRRWGLDGTIPADLGQLDRLTILNLHSNELSGSIPAEIGDLTNLEQLLLHNNSLSGDFPDLSRLSRLKRIWFSGANNRIGEGDGIPTWLNRLTNLEELNLWGNEMGGSIPNLSGLTSLKLLKLQNNSLTGSIPSWFDRDMNSLSGLYLHNNGLTGSIPSELGELTRLRRLWLDRNDLTGSIPPQLGNMTNLGTLNLHTNRLSGSIPTQLGNLSRLQHIGFHNNALTGGIPVQLGNLSELTRLAVSNNQLSGSIPSELGDLGKLTLLWLSENQLTGTIPSALGDLGDTLTSIKLADNNFDTGACVPSGLANVSKNDYSEAGLSTCTN